MARQLNSGDIVYAGYPTAHVHNFTRNKQKQLTLSKVKHLLWGDWVKVTDYDYKTDPDADIKNTAEGSLVSTKTAGMIPVRVRGVSGYMHREDLQDDRLLEIVFVDVGQGDGSLFITPDNKKYVIDSGVGDNMYRYLRWRFAGFKKTHTDFDGFIITHPDKDHYFGFNKLVDDENVEVSNVWHNGIVEQFKVLNDGSQSTKSKFLLGSTTSEAGQKYLDGLVEDDNMLDDFLQDEDLWVKKTTGKPKQFPDLLHKFVTAKKGNNRRFPNVSMLSSKHGEMHNNRSYLPGFGPNNADGCVIEVLGPVVEKDSNGKARLRTFTDKPKLKTTSMNTGISKNGHSVLLKLKYNNLSILFGGDLNSPAEMFLLEHYTGLPVYDSGAATPEQIVQAGRSIFGADVAKACHHGSADFTDVFLSSVNSAATVISSGDEEGHAHPRSDTLGAIGLHGRGQRSLIFSTELSRSTAEFSKREDSPWFKACQLEMEADREDDAAKKAELLEQAKVLHDEDKKTNVTVYGSINLRSDGNKVVLAYMLEKPSRSRRWDVYTLESSNGGQFVYRPVKEAQEAEKRRRKNNID